MLLSNLAQGRNNNLNMIRMVAAFGVLVSHSYVIAVGPETVEPLKESLGITLGTISVFVFFIISGFLVTQSLDRSRSIANWIVARFLRLFPALFVSLLLTVLILGPAVTHLSLHEYYGDLSVFTYLMRNLTLVSLQFELPGVFLSVPYGPVINGSLWTLVYEVACYTGVFLAGVAGLTRARRLLVVAIVLFLTGNTILHVLGWQGQFPLRLSLFLWLAYPFAVGMLAYALRRFLPLSWPIGIVLAIAPVVTFETPYYFLAVSICLAYWVFLVAYRISGPILAYNRLGDYSYGVYIYAFPMQQLMVYLFGPMSPMQNIILATPTTLVLAFFSWHLVERPALKMKSLAGARLARIISGKSVVPD